MSGQALATALTQLELNDFWSDEVLARPAVPRHLCTACRERQARFQYRGVVKADRTHTLCFQCYRAELNRQRARRGLTIPPVTQGVLPLDERERLLAARRRHAQIAARKALEI